MVTVVAKEQLWSQTHEEATSCIWKQNKHEKGGWSNTLVLTNLLGCPDEGSAGLLRQRLAVSISFRHVVNSCLAALRLQRLVLVLDAALRRASNTPLSAKPEVAPVYDRAPMGSKGNTATFF
jgi:hypothetical protein